MNKNIGSNAKFLSSYLFAILLIIGISLSCLIDNNKVAADDEFMTEEEMRVSRKAFGQLQIELHKKWTNVCCKGEDLVISEEQCEWKLDRRVLESELKTLWAEENKPSDVLCGKKYNRLHGDKTNVGTSILNENGGGIYPDNSHITCFALRNGKIYSVWREENNCDKFKI